MDVSSSSNHGEQSHGSHELDVNSQKFPLTHDQLEFAARKLDVRLVMLDSRDLLQINNLSLASYSIESISFFLKEYSNAMKELGEIFSMAGHMGHINIGFRTKNICVASSEPDVEDVNMSNVDSIIENCTNIVEAKYLLQHLFNNCLEQAVAAAKAESLNKESEARVQQLEQQSYISEQLLSTVIEDKNLINDVEGIREYSNRKKSRSPSLASLRGGSTSPGLTESSITVPSTYKVRRHTATADELLYPTENVERIYSVEQKEESKEEEKREKRKLKQGRIVAVRNASNHRVVTRTHTLEGHSKGVLTVATTDDLLLSGSKDRTAKLWDLQTGQELSTLGVHPNNVHVVRFIPNSKLAVSVSMYQVRIWDLRTHECVRMLQSSGQVNEGDSCPPGSRQNTVPFLETVVNAAEVDVSGRLLFTTFAGDVRIWNLEKWASFGRMIGAAHSPRSEVSCLAVCEGSENRPWVFTGSRDHYVKMYQSSLEGEGVHESVVEFSPPHYDNVTCIVPYGGHLFTASKDMNIMKFSLTDYQRDHLELKAHNSYVQGMCLVGANQGSPLLSSVCKEGTIKFWDITSTRRMKLIEEIPKAHSDAINSVCSNNFMMFTASSDQTIGFWKRNIQE